MYTDYMDSFDEKLIGKYLANECSDAEMEQILEWLNVSEDNRKEWLKMRIVSARNVYIHFSDAERLACSYKELLRKQDVQKRLIQKITRKTILRFMRYAASILVLIGMSVLFYKYATDWRYPQMVVVTLGDNEHVRHIMLEDSSQVWLSAGSRIEYPKRFWKNKRSVSVEGKVYFEVVEDVNRPFYVKTETYTVRVLGTSFEVNAFKYSQTSDVTLVDGKVEILDQNLATLCTLLPGQQFETDKLNNCFTLHQVNAEMYASWHGGQFEFDGLTFAEVIRALERHYNVRIIIEDSIAKDLRLVGSLSFQKDIYQMMRTLELVAPIRYHMQINTVVYIQNKDQEM